MMTTKEVKRATRNPDTKATTVQAEMVQKETVVANDPDDMKGVLKSIGGSRSDHWNNVLANQAVQALWLKNCDPEERHRQFSATVAALTGIGPKDELEGMMAAQLIAAHNAAMECYRRAMIGEQSFEGRRENLSQANKLSRTYTTLLEALNRHRGKGQQKVTVEHVHVYPGGKAVVGTVNNNHPSPGDRGQIENHEQPHAIDDGSAEAMRTVTYAPGVALPALWSEDAERLPVPIGNGHGQDAVSDARGR